MHLRLSLLAHICPVAAAFACATPLGAQSPRFEHIVTLGSQAEDRLRLGQLLGENGTSGYLIRSASSLSPNARTNPALRMSIVLPELRLVDNSALPFSLNDGGMWSGRGMNMLLAAGIVFRAGKVTLTLAPQLTTSANRPFQVIPYRQDSLPRRSVWANPFHGPASSIDLPLRFGDRPLQRIDAGQSSLSVSAGSVAFGFATENIWWGPGIRNAIVLSNNAPGFPHAFLQTGKGLHTRVGTFEAQWIIGRLSESDFFDADKTNDARSLSGAVIVWTPPSDSGLSLGMSRTVFAPASNRGFPVGAVFDVLRGVGHPNTSSARDTTAPGPDQVFSFFGRWVFPAAGLEIYGEWARFEQPLSLRDLLVSPGHSQAYTLGLQWARALSSGRRFRLQAEGTYLEPDPSIRVRPVATSYTSRSVIQGYTNRGRTLGAGIGPGSSSQWLAADVFGTTATFGVFAGRIRWDNAALWDPIVPQPKNEDVSLLGGLRGSMRVRGVQVLVEYTHAIRLDYLYQDRIANDAAGTHAGVDIVNRTLSFTLSAAPAR
jgi:hypothetical protein